MYEIMLRYPIKVDGDLTNVFYREHWNVGDKTIMFGNGPVSEFGVPKNDVVRVLQHNVLGWTEIEDDG